MTIVYIKRSPPHDTVLPAIPEQVIPRVLRARGLLLLRPGYEAGDRLVRQQLLPGSEPLGQRRGIVGTVHGAVAGATYVDGTVQRRIRVALLAVALVGAPVGGGGGRGGGGGGGVGGVLSFRA